MLTDILLALAIVGGVGLLCAVLLALASKFFGVPEDEKTVKLRECLPGVNCGACGYKGCDDYAAAMANDGAKPNLCVPGGQATTEALASLLGVEAEETKAQKAFVHCNGTCDATGKKAEYAGVQSCTAAAAVYGGANDCSYGCLGYGDCAAICPVDAICLRNGIAHIDRTLCIGCGKCVSTCPKKIISLLPEKEKPAVMCSSKDKGAEARKLCKNACIACKKCEKSCPSDAVHVINNLAAIDYDKCTSCGNCIDACPTGCIVSLIK